MNFIKNNKWKTFNVLLAFFVVALIFQMSFSTLTPTTQAGGPLAVCNSGNAFKWGGGGVNIPFNPDQGDLGPVNNVDATNLVQQAFDVWGAVPTSTASYINAGQLPVDVDITNFNPFLSPVAPDGLSAIVFDDDGQIFDLLFGPGSGILGFAGPEWVNTITCEITEGVSFLNGPSFTNPTAALDVMVHEFGHYSNLAHTNVNGQLYIGLGDTTGPNPVNVFGPAPDPIANDIVETMYPFYFGPGIGTATLEKDDVASLSTLYPAPGFSTSTGSISGTIFAPNGTTKLTGVNVIARNIADPFNDAVSAISSDFTDGTAQADPVVGTYKIEGLTSGGFYLVYVDEILAGGFSTPLLTPLPGPEEFYNLGESNNITTPDDPLTASTIQVSAGNDESGKDIIFNIPGPNEPLNVGVDGSVQIPLGFTFEICSQPFDSVYVNANGNLTFGVPNSDFTESAPEFLAGPPRIAGLWDDYDQTLGGSVYYSLGVNKITFHWENVPEFGGAGANTFSITMTEGTNHIKVKNDNISNADGLSGVSCGGAITSGFETQADLTSFGDRRLKLRLQPAQFEIFNGGNPVDIANKTVRFSGFAEYNDQFEPNNTFETAKKLTLPFNSAPIENFTDIKPTGNDVDFYKVRVDAGTTLIAETQTGQLDTVIAILDADGNVLVGDDDGGNGLLSRIVFPVTSDGKYIIAVTTFPDFGLTGAGGSGGRYVLDVKSIDGLVLPLGDDTSQEVNLPFSFPFQGNNYNSVFVNSNGNLTFGSGDTDFSESVSELLNDQPRIAPLWDDLAPNNGGLVTADIQPTSATFTFDGVPEFFSTGSNTFSVTLHDDGRVDINYGAISAADGIVGVTPGGGAADPGVTDLSANPNNSVLGTTYELFNGGNPNDLSGLSLSFTP